jgi:hypothetical protein
LDIQIKLVGLGTFRKNVTAQGGPMVHPIILPCFSIGTIGHVKKGF